MTSEATGIRATCYYCDGPLPITRHEYGGRVTYWAKCESAKCAREFLVTGIEGTDENPVFCMIPYFRSPRSSDEWLGMKRKES